jgi:hypothetical protein
MATTATVTVWQDDPGEPRTPGRTMTQPRPTGLGRAPLALSIHGTAPRPDDTPGSEGMRYWSAASTLHRARTFWLSVITETPKWQDARSLEVLLHAGSEVNAYYDRGSLSFHIATVTDHATSDQVRIGTGESPDIVAHEFGHGILDAIRPELWDATFTEVAAFHESFGDISALLCALAVPDIEKEFAALSGSSVFQSSRVSRLGEQMGWALRQQRPDLPDPNCLRDAVNTYFYVRPETLPTTSPSSSLSSEPHNFSRVFTAAFMRVLDEMLKAQEGTRTPTTVRKVAATAAGMLVDAIVAAPVVDTYYHSVGLAMVDEAARKQRGRYRKAIATAFVRTGIITVQEAKSAGGERTARPPKPPAAARRRGAAAAAVDAAPSASARSTQMDLTTFGVDSDLHLDLGDAGTAPHRGAAPVAVDATGAALSAVSAAHFFVEDLFRRNRLDLASDRTAADVPIQQPRSVTHTFHRAEGALRVRRVRVDCGFDVT